MKYIVAVLLLAVHLTGWAQHKSVYPSPIGFVNDFEGDFSKEELSALNLAVKDMLIKVMDGGLYNGIEIAIVTVTDSMFGDEKEMKDYAVKLSNKWGVGDKSSNNGILIAVSRKLHTVYIATGTGMEKLMPNDTCQKIIDEKMLPDLRKGRYYDAVMNSLNGIKEALGIK
jgi:uncharacterized protein